MPKPKARKPKRRTSRIRKSTKRPREKPSFIAKSLLILECDAEKLAAQSISMADEIRAVIQTFAPSVKVEVAKTTTEENLRSLFARLAEDNSRFNLIVVVGHSNASGLCFTSDRYVSWATFAKWVNLFESTKMVLVACQSGQATPVRDLFVEIPTLKEVYAPPVNTARRQSEIVKALVLYLLNVKTPNSELIRLGQIANFLLTGGAIFRWSRKEFQLPKRSAP